MDKTEYRAVIKFFVKEGLTPNEMHFKFIKVYGDSSPSFSTIKKWAAEFKRGPTSLENDPREDVQRMQQRQKSLNKCTIYWMTCG
jgi:histone-lysine N-methyltransferase SETMAR